MPICDGLRRRCAWVCVPGVRCATPGYRLGRPSASGARCEANLRRPSASVRVVCVPGVRCATPGYHLGRPSASGARCPVACLRRPSASVRGFAFRGCAARPPATILDGLRRPVREYRRPVATPGHQLRRPLASHLLASCKDLKNLLGSRFNQRPTN